MIDAVREIQARPGEYICDALRRLLKAAPAFCVFNGTRVDAEPGTTVESLHDQWVKRRATGADQINAGNPEAARLLTALETVKEREATAVRRANRAESQAVMLANKCDALVEILNEMCSPTCLGCGEPGGKDITHKPTCGVAFTCGWRRRAETAEEYAADPWPGRPMSATTRTCSCAVIPMESGVACPLCGKIGQAAPRLDRSSPGRDDGRVKG